MTKTRAEKRKAVLDMNMKTMKGITLAVVVLFIMITISGYKVYKTNQRYQAEIDILNQQIEDEKARTKEIDELAEYMKSDEYIESVANAQLGLVKNNQILIKEK